MTFEQDYLRLLAQISNFTKETTGVPIIDAYFGPKNFAPEKTRTHLRPERTLAQIDRLIEKAKEIDNGLRKTAITSDLQSIKVVVKWLSEQNIQYIPLVEGIFGIRPEKFGQNEIRKTQQTVEDTCPRLAGASISEKIMKWEEKSRITGEALEKMINTEIVKRSRATAELFKKRVFIHLQTKIEDRGVIYKTVTGEPWSGYNYYQGNYTSINAFNLDMPFNKHRLATTLCHEYEHHVSNMFTEKHYRENKTLDLSIVLLHTRRSIISEGTADCATEFLDLQHEEKHSKFIKSLGTLRRMVSLNTAYMLNVENVDPETAAEYAAVEGYNRIEDARKSLNFAKPLTPSGKPNFFKPYIYTYFFGRRDYVLPTFQKARRKNRLKEFFQTLYLTPYSCSTATWKTAFQKI